MRHDLKGTDVVGASKKRGAWGGTRVELFPVIPATDDEDARSSRNSSTLAANATVVATRVSAITTSWSVQGPLPHAADSLVDDPLVMYV